MGVEAVVAQEMTEAGAVSTPLKGKCSRFYLDIQIDAVLTKKPGIKAVGEKDDL